MLVCFTSRKLLPLLKLLGLLGLGLGLEKGNVRRRQLVETT
jgi:hypothetical protein